LAVKPRRARLAASTPWEAAGRRGGVGHRPEVLPQAGSHRCRDTESGYHLPDIKFQKPRSRAVAPMTPTVRGVPPLHIVALGYRELIQTPASNQ